MPVASMVRAPVRQQHLLHSLDALRAALAGAGVDAAPAAVA